MSSDRIATRSQRERGGHDPALGVEMSTMLSSAYVPQQVITSHSNNGIRTFISCRTSRPALIKVNVYQAKYAD